MLLAPQRGHPVEPLPKMDTTPPAWAFPSEFVTEDEPNVLRRWNLLTIDAPLLWSQYWNTMNWFPIALASTLAIVTTVLCVVCSRSSKKEDDRERVIIYHDNGYEIEPAAVPPFEPTWRNENRGSLPREQLQHQKSKGIPKK